MTGAIILAAGASNRMGRPKQTLLFEGQTLLQRAISNAIESGFYPVIVVVGANYKTIMMDTDQQSIQVVVNREWRQGMASSILAGLKELEAISPSATGTLLMVCDQPLIDPGLLIRLANTAKAQECGIAACHYQDTLGTPAYFSAAYFSQLLHLTGKEGAKSVIYDNRSDVAAVPFPMAAIDIDTMEDYEKLCQGQPGVSPVSMNERKEKGSEF